MKRLCVVVIASVLAGGACGGGSDELTIDEVGFSRDRRSVAALVHNDGSSALTGIELRVALLGANGELGAETGSLAYCPPDADCWWAETYAQGALDDWTEVDRVQVTVTRSTPSDASLAVDEIETTQRAGGRWVVLPDENGTVFAVRFEDGPSSGISISTEDGGSVRVGDASDEIRAFFYLTP